MLSTMNARRTEENLLAIECIQKALNSTYGDHIQVVRDHKDTMMAVNDAVIPIPVAVLSTTTRTPQRILKHVVVTASGESEVVSGDVKVADSCVDAVECMRKYLGYKDEPIVETEPIEPVVSNEQIQPVVELDDTVGVFECEQLPEQSVVSNSGLLEHIERLLK